MGHQELAADSVCRKPESSNVSGRSAFYHHHCRFFIHRSTDLLGFGHSLVAVVGAGLLFGIGYGIFDANNMPILCQFVSAKQRATAYGVMNMTGVFAGAAITDLLGQWGDGGNLGNLGLGFAMLAIVVVVALCAQLYFLRPKTDNVE